MIRWNVYPNSIPKREGRYLLTLVGDRVVIATWCKSEKTWYAEFNKPINDSRVLAYGKMPKPYYEREDDYEEIRL